MLKRHLFAALLALAPTACTDLDPETLGETDSELSAFDWHSDSTAAPSEFGGQLATLNGITYAVTIRAGTKDLYWQMRTTDGWTNPQRITGQQTNNRVSLAAFNGYLYMAHTGETESSRIWFTRFDPATRKWSTNILLTPKTLFGPPALAGFGKQLYMVGVSKGTGGYPMWVSTMSTSEVFTTPQPIPNHFSASRPSLAVYANKLYVAHRHGETGEIVYGTHTANSRLSEWTPPQYVRAGRDGSPVRGDDASIAATNGFLHLVHRPFDSNFTYWTYFDQCNWAPELTIDAVESFQPLTLTDSASGLMLGRGIYPSTSPPGSDYQVSVHRFDAPPPPITLPQCLPNQ